MRDEEIAQACLRVASTAVEYAAMARRDEYASLLKPSRRKRHKSIANKTRRVDLVIQEVINSQLKILFPSILILGEEISRYPRSLAEIRKEFVCIVDPVDGTDLLARGFSNWCCSLIIFSPKEKRIRAAAVAHSDGDLYWATDDGAFKGHREGFGIVSSPLHVKRSRDFPLAEASVCFYGQKPERLVGVSTTVKFDRIRRPTKSDPSKFRIYNFAGNPMMVKIPDGAVDVVFELSGQEIHDVLPGAYIAWRAGAAMTDLDGCDIDLNKTAIQPQRRIAYVLAATTQLQSEFTRLIQQSQRSGNQVPKQKATKNRSAV